MINRNFIPISVFAFLLVFLGWGALDAAEYFVNKDGADANNGTSRATAFLTIQKGVDVLNPGDILTIGSGEYLESVQREDLGSLGVDTVIRAEIPGTALLRGDIPAPEFERLEGYRFVYAAQCDRKPNVVLEHNKLQRLYPKANVTELEFDPGFFHYDEQAKMLYISNKDLGAPDECRYTLSVKEYGLKLPSAKRVIVDGLGAMGFSPRYGIWLTAPVLCTIRNCVCYMNVKGIELAPTGDSAGDDCGSDNLIENCVCYGNNFSGISRYVANNDIIRDCYTYRNVNEQGECFGIMHYHDTKGPLLIKDNISWGQGFDFSVKPGDVQERLENCVGLGYVRISTDKMVHDVIGGGNEYDRQSVNAPADTILFLREKDLDQDFEFADPLNMDYRLQPDSRFRGTAPDDSDRGPYPYKPNIFYVSPAGDDAADGLSMRNPWRTLERAFKALRPDDTLYLAEGEYAAAPLNATGHEESAVKILGRGRGTVVITGALDVTDGTRIVFERLNFSGGVTLEDSRDLTFKNCTFFGNGGGLSANKVNNLRVTHSVFADVPVNIKNGSGVFLSANLYANADNPAVVIDADDAILYSDYNNYQNATQSWQVNGAIWAFADLQHRHDRYSLVLTPQFVVGKGVPHLANRIPFKSVGPGSKGVGIYHEYDPTPKAMELVGPFLHSTSDTTANIEWWTSHPAIHSLAWGDTPEMKNIVNNFPSFDSTVCRRYNTFSLTGLKPGQTYYFKIISAKLPYSAGRHFSLPELRPVNAVLSFTTAPAPAAPRVYYVAPDGNDANDGLSRGKAFRTIFRAANCVGPGDTIMITGGEYHETVRIRAAGTEDRPIVFRCVTGEKAVLLGKNLPRGAFELVSKPDIRFDGLYLREQNTYGDIFVICESDRVRITRCLNARIKAIGSSDFLVKNCVVKGGWAAIALSNCPNARVENNVSWDTILRHLTTNGRGPVVARGNIFCECWRNKAHQTLLDLHNLPEVEESDNCFYLRWPQDDKKAVNNMPLPVYKARTGSNSFYANPMLLGIPGWRSGWQQTSDTDFDAFFSANPELILRDIGLQPEAFSDFKLGVADWPYDRAWAEAYVKARDTAEALMAAGKNTEAIAAFTEMVDGTPMCDRLKATLLEKASVCAEQMKDYTQATELAKRIPVKVLSIRRQMQILIAQKKYADLINAFTEKNMGGAVLGGFTCPEAADVLVDVYYYRSIAYCETGNLDAAETDLKTMNKKWMSQAYLDGDSVRDLAFLHLGDFYRDWRKDDNKALEAYMEVCSRTAYQTNEGFDVPKPVLSGRDETLIKATEAACDILRKQGKLQEVEKLQTALEKAQAAAEAALHAE